MINKTGERPQFVGIIFDCVGICLTDGQKAALPELESIIGLEQGKLGPALGGAVRGDYTLGRLDSEQYWQTVITSILQTPLILVRQRVAREQSLSIDEVDIGYLASMFEQKILDRYVPISEVTDLLEKLKNAGYWRGMISNTSKERGQYWIRHFPFLQAYFNELRFSFSSAGKKPGDMKQLVNSLVAGTNLSPSSLVYADDKLQNVEEAVSENEGVGGGIYVGNPDQAGHVNNPKITMATVETLGTVLRDRFGFTF